MAQMKREFSGQARSVAPVLLLVLAPGVALGCSKDPPRVAPGPADAAGDVSSFDRRDGGSDLLSALIDSRQDIPPNTQPKPPADVLFPAPPQVTCAAVSDCEFPPPACADPGCDGGGCPGSSWMVYYDKPQCIAGRCAFEQLYFQCSGPYTCNQGGCRFNGTAVAAP